MRQPTISGHCAFPQTANPELSHARCTGGNTANPEKEFQPCRCGCHLGDELYECGECGGWLAVAPWPNEDEPGEPVYTHVDENYEALGIDCPI